MRSVLLFIVCVFATNAQAQRLVQKESDPQVVGPGKLHEAHVMCGNNEKAIGGGFTITTNAIDLAVWMNRPLDNLTGWQIAVINTAKEDKSSQFALYVVCK